jgi:16S rRNA (uracil1498-N3)-methyltransferase
MSRRRFFVPFVRNGHAEIAGDDARHLTQVLRVEPGQIFEISDNQAIYLAEIESSRKTQVKFRVLEQLPDPPQEIPVHLVAALFKFDHLEMMLEKATELGVTSVHFVRAERSDKGLDKAAEKRIERWRRIALEASQQSRRLRLPELHEPVKLRDALRLQASRRLFLDEDRSGIPVLEAVGDAGDDTVESVALVVGPEGGWPDHERHAAREAGWTSVTLGERVLRAETAAIAAISVVNAVLRR